MREPESLFNELRISLKFCILKPFSNIKEETEAEHFHLTADQPAIVYQSLLDSFRKLPN
jgi:hypothetical protein